jgi:hypothetical protein
VWKFEVLEKAAKMVEDEAKDAIGTYRYGWPQLAESTQEDRVRQGYSANEPLLRAGDLRDSIEHVVVHHESAAYVGSNNPIAVYQELGTVDIPPRSFLGGAARAKEHEIHEEIAKGLYLSIAAELGLVSRLARS